MISNAKRLTTSIGFSGWNSQHSWDQSMTNFYSAILVTDFKLRIWIEFHSNKVNRSMKRKHQEHFWVLVLWEELSVIKIEHALITLNHYEINLKKKFKSKDGLKIFVWKKKSCFCVFVSLTCSWYSMMWSSWSWSSPSFTG